MKKNLTSLLSALALCAGCFSAIAQTELTATPTPSVPQALTERVTFVISAQALDPKADSQFGVLLVLAALAAGVFSVLVVSTGLRR